MCLGSQWHLDGRWDRHILGSSQPGSLAYRAKFQASERWCLKQKVKGTQGLTLKVILWPLYTFTVNCAPRKGSSRPDDDKHSSSGSYPPPSPLPCSTLDYSPEISHRGLSPHLETSSSWGWLPRPSHQIAVLTKSVQSKLTNSSWHGFPLFL